MEKILHIGIAVRDAKQAILNLSSFFDIEKTSLKEYKSGGLCYQIGIVRIGEIALELIEPKNNLGMAEEHIKKFGQGVYHIAIGVRDLTEAIKLYKKRGFESQEIRSGVHGERICFLNNEILPGIYFELVETLSDVNKA